MYRLGTRNSRLATTQSGQVRRALAELGVACELVEIVSEGDQERDRPLYAIEGSQPGLFTKQLERALLAGEIDLAVHSLKDLPTQLPEGLKVAAFSARVNAEDCLIAHPQSSDTLRPLGLRLGAAVGTSSLRREAQLLSLRPDLNVVPIRGNVPTRLDAVREGKVDAVVLARAGLERLKATFEGLILRDLPRETFVPAPGQGVLAVETRQEVPADLARALESWTDSTAERESRVERTILRRLEGGCTLPLGVRCELEGHSLRVRAFLGVHEGEPRHWIGFHHYEAVEQSEEAAIENTVAYFEGFRHG